MPKTGSLSLGSRGQTRFCSLAAFSTLLTVVLDALQLRAMLVWLRFNPASRMISRYLVIMVTSFVMNLRCKAYEFIIKETVPSDRNLGIRFPESWYHLKRNSGTVAPERRFRIARNTQLHKLVIAVNTVNEEGTGHVACPLFIKFIPQTAAGSPASG